MREREREISSHFFARIIFNVRNNCGPYSPVTQYMQASSNLWGNDFKLCLLITGNERGSFHSFFLFYSFNRYNSVQRGVPYCTCHLINKWHPYNSSFCLRTTAPYGPKEEEYINHRQMHFINYELLLTCVTISFENIFGKIVLSSSCRCHHKK